MEQKDTGAFDIEGIFFIFFVWFGWFLFFNIFHYTCLYCAKDEEVFFEHNNTSPEDAEFDAIVTCLEEILQDEKFQGLLTKFYKDNCGR
jgi:hypothetical protein